MLRRRPASAHPNRTAAITDEGPATLANAGHARAHRELWGGLRGVVVAPTLSLSLILAALPSCSLDPSTPPTIAGAPESASKPRDPSGEPNDSDALARQLLREIWAFELRVNPIAASDAGLRASDHLLAEGSPKARAEHALARREFARQITELSGQAGLARATQLDLQLMAYELQLAIGDYELRTHEIPITAESGFHTDYARLHASADFSTARGARNYIARLESLGRVFDEHIADMQRGLARGFTLPAVVLAGHEHSIHAHIVDEVEHSEFFQPLTQLPATIDATQRAQLQRAGARAVREVVVPAYQRFARFMADSYVPGARGTIAAADLPNGDALYAHSIHRYTTLQLTAREIHAIGLDEVARIRTQMLGILAELHYEGSLGDFIGSLREDPKFYATSAEELLSRASRIAKRVDGAMPALFGKLPRQPYTVETVPDSIAPKYTAGRYVPAALDSTRAGTYWVNTHALHTRPLYVLPALTLHEAVPGHHLQIALAKELDGIAEFRRHAGYGAYVEGWALYAESLGEEIGIYETPYDRFGRYTYEMWRACRLVVDTGIHQFGWSRQRAIDYLASHTALSLHEVTTEIDRYISWPGQALGYKLGELEIQRLRARAEERLGSNFDLREFHDAILGGGPLPLGLLRREMEAWIESRAPSDNH